MFGRWFAPKQSKPHFTGQPIIERIRSWDGAAELVLSDADSSFKEGSLKEQDQALVVTEFVHLIQGVVTRGNEQARQALYDAVTEEGYVSLLDVTLHELDTQSWWQPQKMREHARWLVSEARHIEPLKFGILMLGLSGEAKDVEALKTLARHDEFTIVAANAVGAILSDPADEWWQMARQAHGLGKMHLVKLLCDRAESRPDLQGWMLREGWKDVGVPEHVALVCASAGKLEQALNRESVDEELIDGACKLVECLIDAGPAESLDDYEGGEEAVLRLLRHLVTRCNDVRRLHAVLRIRSWVNDELCGPEVWDRRAEQLGWLPEVRQEALYRCNIIINNPEWPQRLEAAFEHRDERFFAWNISRVLGLDMWEQAFELLKKNPSDDLLYSYLLQDYGQQRSQRVVAFAKQHLNPDEITSGTLTANPQPLTAQAKVLDWVVQHLRKSGDFDDDLFSAALACPASRLRAVAIEAAQKADPASIGDKTRAALLKLKEDEPDFRLRTKLSEISFPNSV